MEAMLKEGLIIMDNVEHPSLPNHKTLAYCQEGHAKLRKVAVHLHDQGVCLEGMITYAQTHIPPKYHGIINHSWSGVGDWQA